MDRRLVVALVAGALLACGTAFAQQEIPSTRPPATAPATRPADAAAAARAGALGRMIAVDSAALARAGGPVHPAGAAVTAAGGAIGGAAAGSDLTALEERDTTTRGEYLRAQRAFYRFRTASYLYTSRVFEWQLLSSRLIFAIVMLLVVAGLYFSWLQFRDDLRHRDLVDRLRADARRLATARPAAPSAGGAPAEAPADDLAAQHHVKLGTSGIEVSSSVLGIVILVLSLGFFYLYLVYVYPIHELK